MATESYEPTKDSVLPKEITHVCDDEIGPGKLKYNYIRYEFEMGNYYYWARAYLDEINEVSIFGPFENSDYTHCLYELNINPAIVAYFKRRYSRIKRFTKNGYEAMKL